MKWVQHLHELTQGQLLAIDGKTVRRLPKTLSQ